MRAILSIIVISLLLSASTDRDNDIRINVTLSDTFDSQNLAGLITHPFNREVGEPIVIFEIENDTDQNYSQLFLEIIVESDAYGRLITSTQNSSNGIEVEAGSRIQFSNLDIVAESVPGVSGSAKFDFEMGSEARDLLNLLNRGALVGDDRYTVKATIYTLNESGNARNLHAESSVEYVTSLQREQLTINPNRESVERLSNIDLREERPAFEWDGLENQVFRLVVVEDRDGIDVEQSLNQRFSQPFVADEIRDVAQNVYLDVLTRGNQFELPENLVNALEQGKNYAWQVRSNVRTTTSSFEVASEIWRFSTNRVLDTELIDLLSRLMGRAKVQQLLDRGLQLHRIELDGEVYTAEEAVVLLREMTNKINNNKARVGE